MTKELEVTVVVKLFDKGQLKGFCDITITFDDHEVTVFGYRIVQKDEQPPWIASPASSYLKDGKPVTKKLVEFSRKLDQIIKIKILEEYEKERAHNTKLLDSVETTLFSKQ